ncbi:hypothetical protein [Paenibacillus hexagrammi]|uniref:Uncharacterized protein n=1 Tax=Paenibacillus hexagrammi TaxID=2908839 RepID=A0ABY3SJZ0_9BACL|nr:hypothetical protein [Paenibacillus sp. YPD9-1]UJF34364.1 hypothetical protein L0M14_03920 [Paenibacillus sp. YPD9-1]
MLLYQLAQSFEERTMLQKALQNGAGDMDQLQVRIQEVEDQLYSQAERWKNAVQDAIYLQIPYEAPHLDDDMVL